MKYLFVVFLACLLAACTTAKHAPYQPRPIDSTTAARTAYNFPSVYLNVGTVTAEKDTSKPDWVPPKK